MQNLENLDVFEILITQKLLKCLKDPFLRSALKYFLAHPFYHIFFLVLKRTVSLRWFFCVPTTYVLVEKQEN